MARLSRVQKTVILISMRILRTTHLFSLRQETATSKQCAELASGVDPNQRLYINHATPLHVIVANFAWQEDRGRTNKYMPSAAQTSCDS